MQQYHPFRQMHLGSLIDDILVNNFALACKLYWCIPVQEWTFHLSQLIILLHSQQITCISFAETFVC